MHKYESACYERERERESKALPWSSHITPFFLMTALAVFSVFSFLVISNTVFASTSNGTVDPDYHYAWGENIGWVDLTLVRITDSALSGSAYGENIGWIDLATVTNNAEGDLSGYAWGENVGWVDFSQVSIDSNGIFTGSAYGENIGWITFGTGSNKVATDWRPSSIRGPHGGGYTPPTPKPVTAQSGSATTCDTGQKFNPTSGLPCASYLPPETTVLTSCKVTLTLRQGNRGDEVKCLQTKLTLISDGIFGKLTKASVITFQKNHNLKGDGVVGPITRNIINNIISK